MRGVEFIDSCYTTQLHKKKECFRWKTHQLVSAYCDQVLGDAEHIEHLRNQGRTYTLMREVGGEQFE